MVEIKKKFKIIFDKDSLTALFDQISREIKADYMNVGNFKN